MAVVESLADLVGDTPMLRWPFPHADVYLKLEQSNPGQSVKDRAALEMLLGAEEDGRIRPGDVIIESSSGNTGISLAMLAAERGYRFICVVDNHAAKKKIDILRALGAQIEHAGDHLPDNYHAAKERIEKVRKLEARYPYAYFIDQNENKHNPRAHERTTAREIIRDLDSVDFLIASIGTGGSISGTSRALREHNSNLHVIGVEPDGSIIFGHAYHPFFQSGSGVAKIVASNVDFHAIDENVRVTDSEAFMTCRVVARLRGLLIGGSSGSVIWTALRLVAKGRLQGNIVCIIADSGERYIDTIFNDSWLRQHNLYDQDISRMVEEWLSVTLTQPLSSRGGSSACPSRIR